MGVSDDLWKKIPLDVFINHIMPYVYKKQGVALLDDIRNFVFDYRMIGDYYFYDLNEYCLLVDLVFLCNGGVSLIERVNNCFIDILDRNILFCLFSLVQKYEFFNCHFYFNNRKKILIKIKFI